MVRGIFLADMGSRLDCEHLVDLGPHGREEDVLGKVKGSRRAGILMRQGVIGAMGLLCSRHNAFP